MNFQQQLDLEEQDIKKNMLYGNAKVIMRGVATIDEELYNLAMFNLFELETDQKKKDESRKQIEGMKINGISNSPAITLGTRGEIADGNHRICALFESKIAFHTSILLRRNT